MIIEGKHEQETSKTLGITWSNFGKLDKYLQQPTFPLSLKKKIFMQCIVPVMTYAFETWSLFKKMEIKI